MEYLSLSVASAHAKDIYFMFITLQYIACPHTLRIYLYLYITLRMLKISFMRMQ